MRTAALLLAFGVALAAHAQALTAASGTNVTIVSETKTEPAWTRRVVMKTDDGRIVNDGGTVGDGARSAADGAALDAAAQIADASNVAMTNAMRVLTDAARYAATNAVSFALVVPPETSRSNLTFYCVKTVTEMLAGGTIDRQWVYCNRTIDYPPNRFVVYETFDHCQTNKSTWVNWTNAVTVTHNGRTWSGCHECWVARPAWAVGSPCLTNPNEPLGGRSGFDFGDLTLTKGGVTLFTGFVTNSVTGEVAYFDNGFFKGLTTGE